MWPRFIIPRWIVTRVKIPHWNLTPGHASTLNCDPRSWFHVDLWPQLWIQRWIVTPTHESILNCDMGLGSQFNEEFWPGVIFQRGILTRGNNSTWNFDPGHNSTLNSDPSTYLLPVELWLKKVSKFNSVIKIQQLRRKNPLNIHPRVGIQWGGQNFILHRLNKGKYAYKEIQMYLMSRQLSQNKTYYISYTSWKEKGNHEATFY